MRNEKMTMDDCILNWSPKTKDLLINYVKNQYQDNADVSDDSLVKEYNYLLSKNELHFLFESEYVFNSQRLASENI